MKTIWALTGAASGESEQLDPNLKKQLQTQFKALGLPEVNDEFCDALQAAIANYTANIAIAEQSKPAKVRENLQAAIAAALNLNEKLQNLDGNARRLISKADPGGSAELQVEYLQRILDALHDADHLADDMPQSGRLIEYHRLFLASDISNAMATLLNVKATSTKEGPFESVLEIILQAASGKKVKNVHSLARRALALEVIR